MQFALNVAGVGTTLLAVKFFVERKDFESEADMY